MALRSALRAGRPPLTRRKIPVFRSHQSQSHFTIANQFVVATSPLRLTTSNFILQLNACGYSCYITSSLMRWWIYRLQFLLLLASEVIFRSYFTVSDSRLPQHGGPGPRIYTPQGQSGPIITPGVASYDLQGYVGVIWLRLHVCGIFWLCQHPRCVSFVRDSP
jgi:hypothetical protein